MACYYFNHLLTQRNGMYCDVYTSVPVCRTLYVKPDRHTRFDIPALKCKRRIGLLVIRWRSLSTEIAIQLCRLYQSRVYKLKTHNMKSITVDRVTNQSASATRRQLMRTNCALSWAYI